jgi:unsaturated rhamnogalacturonyl hydrolase
MTLRAELLPAKQIRAAADVLVRYRFSPWRYGDSIAFEGLIAASELADDDRYLAWAHGALRAWAALAADFREIDNTAPGHALCLVVERTKDDALVEVAVRLANYLRARRRTRNAYVSWSQAPLHPPLDGSDMSAAEAALLADPGPGVFVDCLHFDPPFFAHLASLVEDASLMDDAADQAGAYVELLQRPDGLFDHFWLERTGRSYGPGWGRGQGWALLGLLDVLTHLPRVHPSYPTLVAAVQSLGRALAERQRSDGGWATVVTQPHSVEETSTAAFAAAGFAQGVLLGVLDEDFSVSALAAWESVRRQVRGGILGDVSGAVWPSTVASHYEHVPRGYVAPWGQGPLLVAARNISRLTEAM